MRLTPFILTSLTSVLLWTVSLMDATTHATETPDLSALSSSGASRDRIRSALEILNRTQAGARVVRKLQLKMKKESLDDLMSTFRWGDVSKTDAVLTRHYDPVSGTETREREVTVYLKRGAPVQDLLLDLAHEMTHASAPTQWDPYDPELTVVRYIHQALEAPGGEVDALFAECEVAIELKDVGQGLGLSVDRCARYMKDGVLSRVQIQKDFYRVGNWKAKVLAGLARLGARAEALPDLSTEAPKLYSSTGKAPYPVALIREFEDLNQAACENTKKRVDSLRSPATALPQVDQFLKKRCRLVVTQSSSATGSEEPETQVQIHKQANYYRRANDVVSTDTIYYMRKLELLKGVTDDKKIEAELKDFCLVKEPYETKSLSRVKACLKRFKFIAAEHIQKNKAALGKNENSIAELSSDSKRTPVVRNHLPAGDAKAAQQLKAGFSTIQLEKKADQPELLTVEEIERENAKLRTLAGPQFQSALQKLPAEPSKDDFVTFKEVLKDPSDPKSEKINVIAKNPDGSIQYDEASYQNARKAYETQVSTIPKDFELKERTQHTSGSKPKAVYQASGELSKKAYEEARGSVIQALTKKEDQGKVNPHGAQAPQKPKVASAESPTPTEGDKYWAAAQETSKKAKVIERAPSEKKTEIRVTIDPKTLDQEVKEQWEGKVD